MNGQSLETNSINVGVLLGSFLGLDNQNLAPDLSYDLALVAQDAFVILNRSKTKQSKVHHHQVYAESSSLMMDGSSLKKATCLELLLLLKFTQNSS